MHALALALLLASDPAASPPSATPAAPGALAAQPSTAAPHPSAPQPAAGAEDDEDRPYVSPRMFRFGLGGGVISGASGVSPTVQAGVELSPWSPFGLRASFGMVTSAGGGEWTSAELTTALVYRPLRTSALSPYLTAGVQVATLTIARQRETFGVPAARTGLTLATAAPGAGDSGSFSGAANSPSGPVHYSVAPELGAGLGLPLVDGLMLDVGVRYLPLHWEGQLRHAVTGFFGICSPF